MEIHLQIYENLIQWKSDVVIKTGEDYVFAVVESGSIYFKNKNTVHFVSAGEGISLLPMREYVRIINNGKVKIHYFMFSSNQRIFPEGKIVFKDKDYILKTIELSNKIDEMKELDKYSCKKAILLNFIVQYLSENVQNENLANKDDVMFEIQKYLDEFFDNKISFAKIAKKYKLSYSQFFRRFKAFSGVSPTDYLFQIRLERAKTLLANTNTPVSAISDLCGFSDEFYFSKAFKKSLSMSPTAYRKNFKK